MKCRIRYQLRFQVARHSRSGVRSTMASIRLKNLMVPPLTKTFSFGVRRILEEVVDCVDSSGWDTQLQGPSEPNPPSNHCFITQHLPWLGRFGNLTSNFRRLCQTGDHEENWRRRTSVAGWEQSKTVPVMTTWPGVHSDCLQARTSIESFERERNRRAKGMNAPVLCLRSPRACSQK